MENVQESGLKKIVLVDDVDIQLMSAKNRLRNKYELYPAQNVKVLNEILKNITPDLILLDINMPDVNGYEIIKRLKENPEHADIPVIFLTVNKDKASAINAIKLGAADYVTKPFETKTLIDSIEIQLNPEKMWGVKPIILAVDDSPAVLQSITNIFKNLYRVYTLPKPELIHEILSKTTPDLFLLDFQMPQLNGCELIPKIREFPEHQNTPICFFAAGGTKDDVNFALNVLGAVDFIKKPIDEEVLKNKIATHLKSFLIQRRIQTINKNQ